MLLREYKEQKYNDRFLGEHYYLGPESKYGREGDIWGLGMLLLEMVTLRKPKAEVNRGKYGCQFSVLNNEHH